MMTKAVLREEKKERSFEAPQNRNYCAPKCTPPLPLTAEEEAQKLTLKNALCQFLETHKEEYFALADELHCHPELGEEEFFAASFLKELLKKWNFTIEAPIADLPTAFLGVNGKGPKRIAFLAEYDALPEIGHACGHNLIAMMSFAAAHSLHTLAGDKATTYLYGCPAEETIGGKVFMTEAGVFDSLDAAIIVHPDEETTTGGTAYATHPLEVTFYGKPAHIASRTYKGINALDALIKFYTALPALKEEFQEPHILGGIITDGGSAPNVIPARATMKMAVRALKVDYLENTMLPKIKALAESVAKETGTTVHYHHYEPLFMDLQNEPILDTYFGENLTLLGEPYHVKPKDYATGSTDVGNVSYAVRTIHPTIKIGCSIDAHTPEFACAAGSLEGKECALKGAKAMAMTAVDVLFEKR